MINPSQSPRPFVKYSSQWQLYFSQPYTFVSRLPYQLASFVLRSKSWISPIPIVDSIPQALSPHVYNSM